MPQFNLLNEPWIPVVCEGKLQFRGIQEVLTNSHLIHSVRDPIPLVEFGIHRLLYAIVQDIFDPEDIFSLVDILENGSFDSEQIDQYLSKFSDRFDLFNQEYPFLQTPGMEKEKAKPIAGILPSIPSGTASYHFHHAVEDNFSVSPATAARLLCTIAPFMTSGGAGLSPSINGAPPWYVLINGDNLFEALVYNMYTGPLEQNRSIPPTWRNDNPVVKKQKLTSASLLQSYSWEPRRIQLIPGKGGVCSISGEESDILIDSMYFTAGAGVNLIWTDPAVPYRFSAKGKFPLRPQENKDVWRDIAPIALLKHSERVDKGKAAYQRAKLIDQYSELDDQEIVKDDLINLSLYGMRTDMKMKVFEWYCEHLTLPCKIIGLAATEAHHVQEAMEKAESVAASLKGNIKKCYPREGKGNKKALDNLITQASLQFWKEIRPSYDFFLLELSRINDWEEEYEKWNFALLGWAEVVRKKVMTIYDQSTSSFDHDAKSIEAVVVARNSLENSLRGTFKYEFKFKKEFEDSKINLGEV